MIDKKDADDNDPLRVGYAPSGEIAFGTNSPASVSFNLFDIDHLYYWNDIGALVKEDPRLTIAHEFSHALQSQGDPSKFATEAQMNGANFNFWGGAWKLQDKVASNLGLDNNHQATYYGAYLTTLQLLPKPIGVSFTEGNKVAIVREGSAEDNSLDHSLRTTKLNDLMFGYGGKDNINSGKGQDYCYGGDGNDILTSKGSDSVLYGELDHDTFFVSGQDTRIYGGMGNDIIDATEIYAKHKSSTGLVTFQIGDGKDKIISEKFTEPWGDFIQSGVSLLVKGYTEDKLEFVWEYTMTEVHNDPVDDIWYAYIEGNSAIRFIGSQESIYLSMMKGVVGDPERDGIWNMADTAIELSTAIYIEDFEHPWQIEWSDVTQESVAPYDVIILT